MKIITSYTAGIKKQLADRGDRRVDGRLMKATADICLDALRYCTEVFPYLLRPGEEALRYRQGYHRPEAVRR